MKKYNLCHPGCKNSNNRGFDLLESHVDEVKPYCNVLESCFEELELRCNRLGLHCDLLESGFDELTLHCNCLKLRFDELKPLDSGDLVSLCPVTGQIRSNFQDCRLTTYVSKLYYRLP